MWIVAHRGLHHAAPENSIAAVAAAVSAGCGRIEVDVRATADGHLVLMHDASLDRTTGTRASLSRLRAHELGDVQLADGSPIPSLRDALEVCRGRAVLCLDVKEPSLGPQAIHEAAGVGTDIEVWSSHREVVASASDRRCYAALISHGVLPSEGPEALADEARQLGAGALSFFPADLLPSVADTCQRLGIDVMSGTPNDRQTWAYLRRLRARAVVTDRPVECQAWLRELEVARSDA